MHEKRLGVVEWEEEERGGCCCERSEDSKGRTNTEVLLTYRFKDAYFPTDAKCESRLRHPLRERESS